MDDFMDPRRPSQDQLIEPGAPLGQNAIVQGPLSRPGLSTRLSNDEPEPSTELAVDRSSSIILPGPSPIDPSQTDGALPAISSEEPSPSPAPAPIPPPNLPSAREGSILFATVDASVDALRADPGAPAPQSSAASAEKTPSLGLLDAAADAISDRSPKPLESCGLLGKLAARRSAAAAPPLRAPSPFALPSIARARP